MVFQQKLEEPLDQFSRQRRKVSTEDEKLKVTKLAAHFI